MGILIPRELRVGFKKDEDTYTGKLAYIIYSDEKGVLRKKKSWDDWRNHDIEPVVLENIPVSGLVLNKKAGGHLTGWNGRQTYVRVYDPRGFEVEITIPNLLYILENTSSKKGKILEGEFVYGWVGVGMILIPTSAPEYEEYVKISESRFENKVIKPKDLKIGAKYLSKGNIEMIYMGKYDYYDYDCKSAGKKHFFYKKHRDRDIKYFDAVKSLSSLIGILDENPVDNYDELFNELEYCKFYSPIDFNKNEYIEYSFEEFSEFFDEENEGYQIVFFYSDKEEYEISLLRGVYEVGPSISASNERKSVNSLKEAFDIYKPTFLRQYLANGNLYKEDR